MKILIEIDTKSPVNSIVSFDGIKQGCLSRVDLKLKSNGLCYMTVERQSTIVVEGKKQIKKTKEQVFRTDYT
jgi:hypothetical protein